MKTSAEMMRDFFAAPVNVKEFMAEKCDGVLTVEVNNTPKKPRRLFKNDFEKLAKVERNLDVILERFEIFLTDLYIRTSEDDEEFVSLWELCVKEGDGVFETITNWVYPDEIYICDRGFFEPYPQAFSKIHFLENRRDELLNKRDKLMKFFSAATQKKSA